MRTILLVIFAFAFLCSTLHASTPSKNLHDEAYHRVAENLTTIQSDFLKFLHRNGIRDHFYTPFILKPTEDYLKHILHYLLERTNAHFEDDCSISCVACDLQKKFRMNRIEDAFHSFVRDCDCEKKFHKCVHINNGRTHDWRKYDGLLALTATINSPKCYSVEHPIVKCKRYQYFFEPFAQFKEIPKERGTDTIRCVEYELDKSKPKIYQDTFDVPFEFGDLSPEMLNYIYETGEHLIMQSHLP